VVRFHHPQPTQRDPRIVDALEGRADLFLALAPWATGKISLAARKRRGFWRRNLLLHRDHPSKLIVGAGDADSTAIPTLGVPVLFLVVAPSATKYAFLQ